MKKEGKILLNANVTVDDFYKVASQFKDSCRFCVHEGGAPSQLQLKDKNCFFSWKIQRNGNKDDKAELYLIEKKQDRELELKICFQLITVKEAKGDVHVLTYKFSEKGCEEQIFRFFKELGNLVPKCYKNNQIKNEKWFFDEGKRENYISFDKDLNNEMPVPENWINRLAEETYFLGASIVKFSKKNFSEYEKEKWHKDITKDAGFITENQIYKKHIIRSESHFMEKALDKKVRFGFEVSMRKTGDKYSYEESDYKDHLKTYEEFRNFICEKYLELDQSAEEKTGNIEEPKEGEDKVYVEEIKNQISENQFQELAVEKKLLENNVKELTQQILKLKEQAASDSRKIKNLEEKIQESNKQNNQDRSESEKKLIQENEELKTKLNEKKETISRIRNQLDEAKSSNLKQQNQMSEQGKTLFIPCTEENLFDNEIEDFLYSIIYGVMEKKARKIPHNEEKEANRRNDVVKNILKNRTFYYKKSQSALKKERVSKYVLNRDPDFNGLKAEGFYKLRTSGQHIVTYFYKPRYEMVFSCTLSDERRGGLNKEGEIEKRLFL